MCCTWGAQGAGILTLPGGEYMHHSANLSGQDMPVVDTVGAGDTFVAGILFGLLCHANGWGPATVLAFAVDLATKKVQREGFAGLVAAT